MYTGFWRESHKRLLGKLRRTWDDNIKTGPRETDWGDIVWTNLAQDRGRYKVLVI
jgi:hypothetical protein